MVGEMGVSTDDSPYIAQSGLANRGWVSASAAIVVFLKLGHQLESLGVESAVRLGGDELGRLGRFLADEASLILRTKTQMASESRLQGLHFPSR